MAARKTSPTIKLATRQPVKKAPARRTSAASTHPLAHLIPDDWYADDYICREFPDDQTDQTLLAHARNTRQNTLIFGPTGPGKTSCVYAFGATNKIPVVNIACNGAIDPSTLFVRPVFQPDGSIKLVESEVVAVLRHGGILYLDEINFMPPRVASVLHGALDKRRTVTIVELGNEPIKLHPLCQVVATYNPGYEGTKPLNEAFKNRFAIPLEFDYSTVIELQLLNCPSLVDMATQLRASQEAGIIETPISTNMLIEFEELARDLGINCAIMIFLNHFNSDETAAVKAIVQDAFFQRLNDEIEAWKESEA